MAKPTVNEEKQRLDNEAKALANQSKVLFNELISNVVTTRTKLLNQLLDPRRDLNAECGYSDEIGLESYKTMWEREGMGARVVSIWPEECWSQDPEIVETEDSEDTEFETAWKSLEERYNLYHYLQRIDELSGIGEFGILLLGFDDGKNLDQPLTGIVVSGPKTGQRVENWKPAKTPRLTFVRAFDQTHVNVSELDTDKKSPHFGKPKYYEVNLSDPSQYAEGASDIGQKTKVHWTRVIHVCDNRTNSETFGTPRMKKVWNRLLDLRKLLGGSAEMFWKGAFPGYSFETQPELGDVQIDVEALREEFAEFSNGLNRFLATSGITAKSLEPQVASPEAHVMVQLNMIATTIRVPLRILLGSEQAQLASEQDRNTFDRRIKVRREKYLSPWLIRVLIDRLILIGVLPEPVGDESNQNRFDSEVSEIGSFAYSVKWPEVQEQTPKDKAEWAKVIIEVVARYIQSGANQLLPEREFLILILDFDPDEVDAILEAAEERVAELDEKSHEEAQKEIDRAAELSQRTADAKAQSGGEAGVPASNK